MSAVQDGQREQQLVRGTVVSVVAKGTDTFQIEVREEGAQYTRKLWTKDTALVQQVHAQGVGQRFDFLCNVSHWRNQSNQPVRSLWLEEIAQYGSLQAPAQVPQPGGLPGLPGAQSGLPVQPQPALQPGWVPAPGPAYLPGVSVTPPMGAPGTPGALPMPMPGQPMQAPLPPQQTDPQWQSIPPVIKEDRILRQTAMKCACIMQAYLPDDQRGSVQALEALAEWFVRYFKGGPQSGQQQQTNQSGHPQDAGPPDWVTQEGPVPQDYQSGVGYGSEDGGLSAPAPAPTPPGAYTGGFPS